MAKFLRLNGYFLNLDGVVGIEFFRDIADPERGKISTARVHFSLDRRIQRKSKEDKDYIDFHKADDIRVIQEFVEKNEIE